MKRFKALTVALAPGHDVWTVEGPGLRGVRSGVVYPDGHAALKAAEQFEAVFRAGQRDIQETIRKALDLER
jgi:hypothetical protein